MNKEQAHLFCIKSYQDLKDKYTFFPNTLKQSIDNPEEMIEFFRIAMECIGKCITQEGKERPKGEWKLRPLNQSWEVYCTNCNKGEGFIWDEDYLEEYKKHPQHSYCSYCGADMRESEVEE